MGLLAVGMGAYTDHGLAATPEQMQSMETAIRYNGYYAIVVLLVAFMAHFYGSRWLKYIAVGFAFAATLFVGSIYLSVIMAAPKLVYLTPVGGSLIMLAWLALAITFFINKRLCKKS